MLERQYTASAFTIDFNKEEVLLVYNQKLKKWLQPGGHIEGLETPEETVLRETREETGVEVKIIGLTFYEKRHQPFAVERYINSVGDMIDIQFCAIPITKRIESQENKEVNGYH